MTKMTKFVLLVLGILGHKIVKGDVATQVYSLSPSCSDKSDTLFLGLTLNKSQIFKK